MLTIGTHVIRPVLDTVVRAAPTALYPTTSDPQWAQHADLLEHDGVLQFGIGGYVLHTGDRLVLVDLGVGPTGWTAPSGAVMAPGHLLTRLRELDIEPTDVTDVVFSHLHPDHVGWASVAGTPTFPNATYRCHQADWDYFVIDGEGDPAIRTAIEPIAGRLDTWDRATTALFPGVDLVEAPGHTPGSTILVVSTPSGERAILLGDVIHCAVELLDDDWATIGDVDPELATRTRAKVARELEGSGAHVTAAHFPELQFGRLVAAGGDGRRQWGYTGSPRRP